MDQRRNFPMTNTAFVAQALDAIRRSATSHGLFASPPPDGYTMVFARDAMITLLGASPYLDRGLEVQLAKSIATLAKHQSKTGQIPNAVDLFDAKRPKNVSYSTVDSTLWWLLGLHAYSTRFGRLELLDKYDAAVQKAFFWLECQDTGEDAMPEQLPTSDWQDAFPHKYGHTINTQALYYAALRSFGQHTRARAVSDAVNGRKRADWTLWSRENGYYLPWSWKTHDSFRETEYWFDTLGNLLAVLSGLSDESQSKSILDYIFRHDIHAPYPARALYPPLSAQTAGWQPYFDACAARTPHEYLNGGIWPFIGGMFVCALVSQKRLAQAATALSSLQTACLLSPSNPFPEWIHPLTRESYGENQAWSAGMSLAATAAVETRKVTLF